MLEIESIGVTIGGRKIIRSFSHQFMDGSITAVVGLNGAGKSTLLRAIAGIIVCEGDVVVNGSHFFQMPHKERAKYISYLPQVLPHPHMDTETLIAHGRFSRQGLSHVLSQQDRQAVSNAMELTNTSQLRYRQISGLSGGERQRVFLAMVIAQDTPVILLDEPDTYMDVIYKQELVRIIKKLKDIGKTILMTSHDLPQSFQTADRILVIKDGYIVGGGETGDPESLRQVLTKGMGVSVRKLDEDGLCTPFVLEWGDRYE